MNTRILLLCIPLLGAALKGTAQNEKTYSDKKQRLKFLEGLAEKYNSPGVYEVLKTDKTFEFEHYIDGHSESELVESYSTVIHELLHGYNGTDYDVNHYFIEPGVRIAVKLSPVYKSKELNNIIRKGLQDSIFRYNLYVGARVPNLGHGKKVKGINDSEKNEASSIQQGIYGLLDEFNAYYYGTLAIYELYDYYLARYGKTNSDAWKDYKHEVMSDALAYYEFNLFMGWYLLYAKEKYPDIYKGIITNKNLRVAFTFIHDRYAQLTGNIDERLNSIRASNDPDMMDVMDFSGSDDDVYRFLEAAGIPKEQLYTETISVVNGKKVVTRKRLMDKDDFEQLKLQYTDVVNQIRESTGSDLFLFYAQPLRQIRFLKKQMTPEMEDIIDQLKIKGLTTANYRNYLE